MSDFKISSSLLQLLRNMEGNLAEYIVRMYENRYSKEVNIRIGGEEDYWVIKRENDRQFFTEFCNYITFRFNQSTMSFLPKGKVCLTNDDGTWKRANRQDMRPAKLVRKIIPKEIICKLFSDQDFEKFSNAFNAMVNTKGDFKEVSGYDIAKWYDGDRYASYCGTLNDSCMRSMDDDVFEIYTANTNVVRMVILTNEEGNLIGRALVWKLDDVELMDRIYGNDITIEKFKSYAKDHGYWHKRIQSYDDPIDWITPEGQVKTKTFVIPLRHSDLDRYPYCDTFKYLCRHEGVSNNRSYSEATLEDTDGGVCNEAQMVWDDYHEEDIEESSSCRAIGEDFDGTTHANSCVYSSYHNTNVIESHSVYSEYHNAYLNQQDAVQLHDESWVSDNESYEYCEDVGGNALLEDVVCADYGKYEGSYILDENSTTIDGYTMHDDCVDAYEEEREQEQEEEHEKEHEKERETNKQIDIWT